MPHVCTVLSSSERFSKMTSVATHLEYKNYYYDYYYYFDYYFDYYYYYYFFVLTKKTQNDFPFFPVPLLHPNTQQYYLAKYLVTMTGS